MDRIIDLLDAAAKAYPIKALAPEIGKGESTLRNELNGQEGYKLGLITAVNIWRLTKDFRSLDRIEHILGRVAFPTPIAEHRNMSPIMRLAARLTKEFGEHMQEIAEAMADGVVTAKEARRCLEELGDVIEACVELQAHLQLYLEVRE